MSGVEDFQIECVWLLQSVISYTLYTFCLFVSFFFQFLHFIAISCNLSTVIILSIEFVSTSKLHVILIWALALVFQSLVTHLVSSVSEFLLNWISFPAVDPAPVLTQRQFVVTTWLEMGNKLHSYPCMWWKQHIMSHVLCPAEWRDVMSKGRDISSSWNAERLTADVRLMGITDGAEWFPHKATTFYKQFGNTPNTLQRSGCGSVAFSCNNNNNNSGE